MYLQLEKADGNLITIGEVQSVDEVGVLSYHSDYRKIADNPHTGSLAGYSELNTITLWDDDDLFVIRQEWRGLIDRDDVLNQGLMSPDRMRNLAPFKHREILRCTKIDKGLYQFKSDLDPEFTYIEDLSPFIAFPGTISFTTRLENKGKTLALELIKNEGRDLTLSKIEGPYDMAYFVGHDSGKIGLKELEVRVGGKVQRYFFDTKATLYNEAGKVIQTWD